MVAVISASPKAVMMASMLRLVVLVNGCSRHFRPSFYGATIASISRVLKITQYFHENEYYLCGRVFESTNVQ